MSYLRKIEKVVTAKMRPRPKAEQKKAASELKAFLKAQGFKLLAKDSEKMSLEVAPGMKAVVSPYGKGVYVHYGSDYLEFLEGEKEKIAAKLKKIAKSPESYLKAHKAKKDAEKAERERQEQERRQEEEKIASHEDVEDVVNQLVSKFDNDLKRANQLIQKVNEGMVSAVHDALEKKGKEDRKGRIQAVVDNYISDNVLVPLYTIVP